MATQETLVSEAEYLAYSGKPNCEYFDGVMVPKAMGTRKHAKIQWWLCQLLNERAAGFEPLSEQTVRLREGKWLVPDVAVQRLDAIQDPYPELPIHLCVEILSPRDRLGEMLAKGEAYHDWGVPYFWVVDPETRQAWSYAKGGRPVEVPADGELTAGEISISMVEIFSVL